MDLRKLKKLIDLVQESGIGEIEITEGEEKVRISRSPPASAMMVAPPMQHVSLGMPMGGTGPAGGMEAAAAPPPAAEPKGHTLKSPMVGTFYRAPEPGAKPFVEAGTKVRPDSIVCIIEVMKLMNSVEAGIKGTVTHVLVENGAVVEPGQALVAIQP